MVHFLNASVAARLGMQRFVSYAPTPPAIDHAGTGWEEPAHQDCLLVFEPFTLPLALCVSLKLRWWPRQEWRRGIRGLLCFPFSENPGVIHTRQDPGDPFHRGGNRDQRRRWSHSRAVGGAKAEFCGLLVQQGDIGLMACKPGRTPVNHWAVSARSLSKVFRDTKPRAVRTAGSAAVPGAVCNTSLQIAGSNLDSRGAVLESGDGRESLSPQAAPVPGPGGAMSGPAEQLLRRAGLEWRRAWWASSPFSSHCPCSGGGREGADPRILTEGKASASPCCVTRLHTAPASGHCTAHWPAATGAPPVHCHLDSVSSPSTVRSCPPHATSPQAPARAPSQHPGTTGPGPPPLPGSQLGSLPSIHSEGQSLHSQDSFLHRSLCLNVPLPIFKI